MSARDAARATARAVARPTRFAVLLPVEVLHALHAATGCDVVTVYLSNPAAPHDRASYVLLGQSGASAAFSPYLRGPLRPQSLERFSAHDRVKALLVPDVRAHAAFRGSVFCRHHAIRSVARLSVRLPTTAAAAPARRKSAAPPAEPPPVPGALPPFLEVFLSWRRPRENGALAAASAAAKSLLLKRAESLLADPELRLLMDPRAIAVRHRKLQRIADRFHDDHLPAIDSSAASAAVARAIEACCRAVAELLDGELFVRKGDDRRISFWWLDRWGARPSDHDPRQFFVHPPPRAACGSPPAAVAAPPAAAPSAAAAPRPRLSRGVLRFTGATGRSVGFERIERAPPAWRALHGDVAFGGPSLVVPLFSGSRPFALLRIEAAKGGGLLRRAARLWQVLPALEDLLRDVRERLSQLRDNDARVLLTAFTSSRFRPKQAAMSERLRQVVNLLGVTACSMTRAQGGRAAQHWTSADAATGGDDLLGGATAQALLLRLAAATVALGERPLAVSARLPPGGRAPAPAALFAYRRSGHPDGPPQLRRAALPAASAAAAVAHELLGALRPDPRDPAAVELIVVPIYARDRQGSGRREVGSLLALLCRDDEPRSSRPWLLTAVAVARALGLALFTAESLEDQASLLSWATAGVGSIHDVVGALGRSVELLRLDGAGRDQLGLAADTLEGIRDQMALLDALARGEPLAVAAPESARFGDFIGGVIRRAILISGNHPEDVDVAVAAPERVVAVGGHLLARVAGALTNAIANALKYGGAGRPAVAATLRSGGEVLVTIENRCWRRTSLDSLRAATQISRQVRDGDAADVLMRLLDQSRGKSSLRGVGTWLTTRVVREVLNGAFELTHDPVDPASEVVTVRAQIRFRLDGSPVG